jgi:hypothetical protein
LAKAVAASALTAAYEAPDSAIAASPTVASVINLEGMESFIASFSFASDPHW